MFAQRILLYVVLSCLGTAAILGAAFVLVAPGEVIFELTPTFLLTAVFSGALLGMSAWLGNALAGTAAALAMGLLAAEFMLLLANIWDLPTKLHSNSSIIVALILAVGGPGAAAIVCLYLRRQRALAVLARLGDCDKCEAQFEVSVHPPSVKKD